MPLTLKREPKFKPRRPRSVTFVTTVVLLPDDREVSVQMKNISTHGFMAITRVELAAGMHFGVAIPGRGILRAQVRWSEGGAFGARFQTPLTLEVVEAL